MVVPVIIEPGPSLTKRQRYLRWWNSLYAERSTWDPHWKRIAEVQLPRAGRFFVDDQNEGREDAHGFILDNTATMAAEACASGIMAYASSPARPWFRLASPDPDLNRNHVVKEWLDSATDRILRVFANSNTYRVLHQVYGEMAIFGTGCAIMLPDDEEVLRLYPVTIGQFCLADDDRGKVCTFAREYQLTVMQMVQKFGYDRLSDAVQRLWTNEQYETYIPIIHMVAPRHERNPEAQDNLNMEWESVHFERGGEDHTDKLLEVSGFTDFPVLCPRWATAGGDVYGYGPGMVALGDVNQLQEMTIELNKAVQYQVEPPLQVPANMRTRLVDNQPGGQTPVEQSGPNSGIRSAWDVNLNLEHHQAIIFQTQSRIRSAYFSDLFRLLSSSDDTNRTATEVRELVGERLLALGPVAGRIDGELLRPLVNFAFNVMLENGMLPDIPEELEGVNVQPIFVSVLAQAQAAVGIGAVDRLLSTMLSLVAAFPDVVDKLNVDAALDEYADMLGVPPVFLRDSNLVQQLRQAKAAAQAAQAQSSMIAEQAQAANHLANAPTGDQNALTDVAGLFSQVG